MTAHHIVYIPMIFLSGFILGSVTMKTGENLFKTWRTQYPSSGDKTLPRKLLLPSFLVFAVIFIATHIINIPWGPTAVKHALGGLEIFDKQPSFNSNSVYDRLQAYSQAGRHLYKRFTYTTDLVFPISLFIFLFALVKHIAEKRLAGIVLKGLLSLPMVWLVLDLLENAVIYTLLSTFPTRYNLLAIVLGYLTTGKFAFLFFSIVVPPLVLLLRKKI
jgi:hypothetical protein